MISGLAYIIVLIVSVIAIIGGFVIVYRADSGPKAVDGLNQQQQQQQRDDDDDTDEDEDDGRPGRRRRRRVVAPRRAAAIARNTNANANNNNDDERDDEHEDDDMEEEMSTYNDRKLGTKKMLSLQRKEERRREREALEEQRKLRKQREILDEEERLKRKHDEAEQAKKEEEEEAKRRAEIEAAEQQLLNEWKGSFEVVEQGTDVIDQSQLKQRDSELIQFIKDRKIVLLEELAIKFRMKTQEVVDKLRLLDESGELTGVIDDRGKFVHTTVSELDRIATFIMRRGRVSIDEITKECNRVIDLTSKNDIEFMDEIDSEQPTD